MADPTPLFVRRNMPYPITCVRGLRIPIVSVIGIIAGGMTSCNHSQEPAFFHSQETLFMWEHLPSAVDRDA
jgi:hypothetical protein